MNKVRDENYANDHTPFMNVLEIPTGLTSLQLKYFS